MSSPSDAISATLRRVERRLAYFDSTSFDWHDGGHTNPECPDRSRAIRRRLGTLPWVNELLRPAFEPIARELLERVHCPKYLEKLERLSAFGGGNLGPDTYLTGQSWDAALLAAGAAVAAVEGVFGGHFERAFCALRPPGHHAGYEQGMGFCLINHVILAAEAALAHPSVQRVAIFDWDVHHGNGTEELAYHRADIFYASCHQYPLYPYTGDATSRGEGAGLGTTLNVPLAIGTGDHEMLDAWRDVIEPALREYKPDILLISAGFDGDERDSIAQLRATSWGFQRLSEEVRNFANEVCGGRVVSVLEGGYDLESLAENVCIHLECLR